MIQIKTVEEIKVMAEGGRILAKIMGELAKQIRPGTAPQDLETLAERLVLNSGGQCSFKGYEGFPNCLCVSPNSVMVHGLPTKESLKEGDIVSLDLGLFYKGFHTDMARTFAVGRVSPEAKKLIAVTREALERGKKQIRSGARLGNVSLAIQQYVESEAFNVIRELCGHGIGRELHEDPQILNFGEKDTGAEIKQGMTFCLEPMVTAGHWKLKKSPDGFGLETQDGSLTCHFEDTIVVAKDGYRILTR